VWVWHPIEVGLVGRAGQDARLAKLEVRSLHRK
jgi:hypothetical protein